jgi:hypothetical protein
MANDREPQDWERQDWDEPPAIELPGPLSLLSQLPTPAQIGLALVWWVVATLSYQAIGMATAPAALVTLSSLVACVASILLYLWTRRSAWRDQERGEFWRLCGWLAIGAIFLSSLPGVVLPIVVLLVLACYAVIVFPLQLLR